MTKKGDKIKDIRSNLDKYKELNLLYDDLVNNAWRMMYGKNRVNNEIDNIDCDIAEDARTYLNMHLQSKLKEKILIDKKRRQDQGYKIKS